MENEGIRVFSIFECRFTIALWLKNSVIQCKSVSDRTLFEKTKPICVLPPGAPGARSFLKIIILSKFSAVFANSAVN